MQQSFRPSGGFDGRVSTPSVFTPGEGVCASQPRAATVTARLAALAKLADHLVAEADSLDATRDENVVDIETEVEADALRSVADRIKSILRPDVDLESSAAAQHYIESGCWPTRFETALWGGEV